MQKYLDTIQSIFLLAGTILYAAWMLHVSYPELYHRMMAWLATRWNYLKHSYERFDWIRHWNRVYDIDVDTE